MTSRLLIEQLLRPSGDAQRGTGLRLAPSPRDGHRCHASAGGRRAPAGHGRAARLTRGKHCEPSELRVEGSNPSRRATSARDAVGLDPRSDDHGRVVGDLLGTAPRGRRLWVAAPPPTDIDPPSPGSGWAVFRAKFIELGRCAVGEIETGELLHKRLRLGTRTTAMHRARQRRPAAVPLPQGNSTSGHLRPSHEGHAIPRAAPRAS